MVVKIDLEKAYDRLEWCFIRKVLTCFGFPPNIIKLIMSCISSSSTSLLFNGEKLSSFAPSGGIRQGNPLSPFIFLLCMEYLNAQIEDLCDSKQWIRVKASSRGPGFSHIFFADDLLLFARANTKNCDAITTTLNSFCDMAEQKVNNTKSKIFFSSNVNVQVKLDICKQLGIQATNNLGRYLGFPILHKGRNGNAYNFVIERVQDKLASWKARVLSPAGKRVLINSASIPIVEYYMQCCALPTKVCKAVDKLHKDFLWGSTEEKRKLHLVN